uniref:NADH-ubiquinone oxidoreductase chain 6 n=1 Tax=Endomychus coccineus TaxID=295833 RepID=S4SUL4_9CUCU|nr:NADH dehydrogenase subunit 6 [Endomychus coccineus]
MSLILMISILFIIFSHPITMGMMLLIQTILISLNISMLNFNSWYSYILILIMIGGMLILFIYMTSIASNEKFNFSYLNLFTIFIIFIPINFMNKSIFNFNSNYNFNLSMSKFYNMPSSLIMLMIIFYLLLTMIAIVKICKLNKGTLQQKF